MSNEKLCTFLQKICVFATFVMLVSWVIFIWQPSGIHPADSKLAGMVSYALIDKYIIIRMSATYGLLLFASYIIYLIYNPPRRKQYYDSNSANEK